MVSHGCIQIWAKIRNSLFRPYLYTTVYVLKKKHKVTTENLTKRGPKWKRLTDVHKYGRSTDVHKCEKGPRFRGLLTYITTYILTKKISKNLTNLFGSFFMGQSGPRALFPTPEFLMKDGFGPFLWVETAFALSGNLNSNVFLAYATPSAPRDVSI